MCNGRGSGGDHRHVSPDADNAGLSHQYVQPDRDAVSGVLRPHPGPAHVCF